MEELDLYDLCKRKTGKTIRRGDPYEEGYVLCVQVVVFDSAGRILIQKRRQDKEAFPGYWDLSVCGGVQAGEESMEAAERELYEELGIRADFKEKRPNACISFGRGFTDVYLIQRDLKIEALTLQQEEVEEARWAELEEVLALLEEGRFVTYYPSYIRFLWESRGAYGSIH